MRSDGSGSHGETSPLAERSVKELLTRSEPRGHLLQELSPIARSVPWLRSQRFWAQAGVEVFTSGEVPYVATNDGEQSRKALEVYLESLRAADGRRSREEASYVLEIGTGTGLFAKLFLDQLEERSRAEHRTDYERTTYIIADFSPGLLEDTRTSGVFARHEARLRRVLLPAGGLRAALEEAVPNAVGAIRAIYANYVLDSMPFTILSQSDKGLFELQIRTRLRDDLPRGGAPPQPPKTSDVLELESWLEQVVSVGSAASRSALTFEAEYVRVARNELPLGEFVPPSAEPGQWVHSFGAVDCLADAVGMLQADGYFIASDYSFEGVRSEPVIFQTFGTSLAAGVNFAQLLAFARARSDWLVGVPEADPSNLQARLFGRRTPEEVVERFRTLYSKEAAERAEAPYREAVALADSGQYEAARWKFEQAHRLQPYNWSLLEAITTFLTYTVEEHAAGLELCKRALQLNHLSSRLWNSLGDCYYGLDALDSAEQAYEQATRVNPSDVRGRCNLAYVHLKRGAAADALRIIGEALALDRSGEHRDELLGKQSEALQAITADQLRELRSNLRRSSGHYALPQGWTT